MEPSTLNCTVPPGVPLPGAAAVTATVKLIDWFNTEGFADELIVAVAASWLTTWLIAAEVLPLKLPSPRYWAVIDCEPTVRPAVL